MRNPQPDKPGAQETPAPASSRGIGRPEVPQVQSRETVWRRVTGKPQLETAMRQRLQPYSYESNSGTLKWTVAGLIVWAVAAAALAWSDRATVSTLAGFEAQGIRSIPTTSIAPEDLFAFASAEGIDCSSQQDLTAPTPGCDRLLDIRLSFARAQDRSDLIYVSLVILLVVIAFPWGTLVHRAGRNLLTLKSNDQRVRPDSLVLWSVLSVAAFVVFAPFGQLVVVGGCVAILVLALKVLPGLMELFKGSDPAVRTDDGLAWKRDGTVSPSVYLWLVTVAMAFVLNPLTTMRFWSVSREDLSDLIVAVERLVWADLVLVLPALTGIYMLVDLHLRQQAKRAKVGPLLVTPPMHVDPLEEELSRSVRTRNQKKERGRRK
jgi:hypothetical protein